jgi:serine/threonine protein kinase
MGLSFRRPIRQSPRPLRFLRYRSVLIILFLLFCEQQHLFYSYRQALSAKYAATHFNTVPDYRPSQSRQAQNPVKEFRDTLVAGRQDWRVLGSGWEGTIYTYGQSVIKTFNTARSPLRNCVDRESNVRWPSEIPASLHFGSPKTSTLANHRNYTPLAFLPVQAYFQVAPSSFSPPEWHLVTPFLPGGNLEALSKRIRSTQNATSFRELDLRYRSSFNRLLESLDSMHREGYCHDDVKPNNIFIDDGTVLGQQDACNTTAREGEAIISPHNCTMNWILGDLGNVRHVGHPYHTSRIWRENHQLHDCRANDAVRALKTYLQFLRAAAADAEVFDAEFFEQREPLSVLFWSITTKSLTMSASQLRFLSLSEAPSSSTLSKASINVAEKRCTKTTASGYKEKAGALLPKIELAQLFSEQCVHSRPSRRHKRAVGRAIKITASEGTARFWAMTRIFGLPKTTC